MASEIINYMNQKDWLLFLHLLHNKIRGSKGIKLTGLPALNEISNFLLLKFAEKYVDEEELPEYCKFSFLYENYATDEEITKDKKIPNSRCADKSCYKLWDVVYNVKNSDCVLRILFGNDFFKKYLKSTVNGVSAYTEKPIMSETIQEIFNLVYNTFDGVKLNYDFYDAFGSAYEQFKTAEVSNTGKHTGQHFTPSTIKQYIILELKPKGIELFYEPCCGSGGFIHTAYSYIHAHDRKNYGKFKTNIYANECNPEITKSLMINMLLHNIPITNIKEQDSLDVSDNCIPYREKFDIIATNPPFGMKTDHQIDDYWKPIISGKSVIKNSTAQFLVHISESLKKGGRAGVVIDRGILNNGARANTWESKFRQWLLTANNVYKIILLPTGIFDYTTFNTAIIFFTKGIKTKEIKFYEGVLNDKKEFNVNDKPFKVLTFDQIKENGWFFDANLQESPHYIAKNGWVKMKDYIGVEIGTLITKGKNSADSTSGYPVYGGGDITFYTTKKNRSGKYTIVISRSGVSPNCVRIVNGDFFLNVSGMSLKLLTNDFKLDFIKYFFMMHQSKIYTYASGAAQKNMNTSLLLESFLIPKLDIDHQLQIVKLLDDIFQTRDINDLVNMIGDIDIFELLIQKRYDEFKSIVWLIYRCIEAEERYKQYEEDKDAIFECKLKFTDHQEKRLEDITLINNKNYSDKNLKDGTEISYIDISCIENAQIIKYNLINKDHPSRARRIISKHDILISSVRPNLRKVAIYDKDYNNPTASTGFFALTAKSNLYYKYLYYYLRSKQITQYLVDNSKGQAYPAFNSEVLKNTLIRLPSLENQKKIIADIEMIEQNQQVHKKHWNWMKQHLDTILDKMSDYIKEPVEDNNDGDVIEADDLSEQDIPTMKIFKTENKPWQKEAVPIKKIKSKKESSKSEEKHKVSKKQKKSKSEKR